MSDSQVNSFNYGDYWEILGDTDLERRKYIEAVVSRLEQVTVLTEKLIFGI